ncbi:MAG TPA: ComF family protein [Actinomycetota bacterium]|nr:ComF family protein [Actinomycetota bacterium]
MLRLAAPDRCTSCGDPGSALCSRCGRELPACPRLEAPPPLRRLGAGWLYEGAARSLVLGLKLRGMRGHGAPLAEAMCRAAWRDGLDGDAVTWVPCLPADARSRGYDHAEVLARAVARRLGLPADRLLDPSGPRSDQTVLGAAQRRENLKDAFVARPVHGRVVLVDDVMTTGATICTCARALLKAGAVGVEGLVGCRA